MTFVSGGRFGLVLDSVATKASVYPFKAIALCCFARATAPKFLLQLA